MVIFMLGRFEMRTVRIPRASTKGGLSAVLPLLLLLLADSGEAQSRVYSTCEALADGVKSSVVSNTSVAVLAFCHGAEQIFTEAMASLENDAATVVVDGKEVKVADLSPEHGVAITTSSSGVVPFKVNGGDHEDASSSGAETGVSTRTNDERPDGPWYTIVSLDVESRDFIVWKLLSEHSSFLDLAFHGISGSISSTRTTTVVKLDTGGTAIFRQGSLDDDAHHMVLEMRKVTRGIYPGFNFDGSRIYVQVSTKDVKSSTIELGWGPPSSLDVGGHMSTGVLLMEALLLEILANFEWLFGRRCELGKKFRTVEGDCNSLEEPTRGRAGAALRRLGEGIDPAYPNGNRSIPAGPLDVNVRAISNALFATSPGATILEEQAKLLESTCEGTTTPDGTEYEVCPFDKISKTPEGGETSFIPFDEVMFNELEDLIFRFSSSGCVINITLQCSGETSVHLAPDPCGAQTNRLFNRVGCVAVPGQDGVLANSADLTDLFFTFGQFIDHDYGLSPLSQISREQPGFSRVSRPPDVVDEFPIIIPDEDYHFPDREEFEFERVRFSEEDTNSHVNLHSSYLDGSQIYGMDFTRARLLRSFEGGKLDLSNGNLPPFNRVDGPGALGAVVENSPNAEGRFFVVGDVRGNEQVLLLCVHVIWLREHNLVAEELAEAFPDYDDELLYQTARAIVIAEYQCIVYNEWLPLLLGSNAPSAGDFKYDKDLDATVTAIFTAAAYRFGHSLVGSNLLSLGPGKRSEADMELIPVRDVFFKPELVYEEVGGIEPFVRGGAWHACKELDAKVVDELRNFLVVDFAFEDTNPKAFDLVAINLQRGRDMGLPSFNDVRELFGLERYTSFSQFIDDPNLADLASELYKGDVDLVDLFVGGLSEEHVADSQLGESFNTIIADQFKRSRDGDRFFYTGIEFKQELIDAMPRILDIQNHEVKFKDIILRNTEITDEELGSRPSVFQT